MPKLEQRESHIYKLRKDLGYASGGLWDIYHHRDVDIRYMIWKFIFKYL